MFAVRKELLDAISAVEGHTKALFMDKALIGVLGLVAEFSALKVRCLACSCCVGYSLCVCVRALPCVIVTVCGTVLLVGSSL